MRNIEKTDYRDILFILPDHNSIIIEDIIKYIQNIALRYNFYIRFYKNIENISINKLIQKIEKNGVI